MCKSNISRRQSGAIGAVAVLGVVLLLSLAEGWAKGDAPATQPADPAPSPQLQPRDVVRIVVGALGRNDQNDSGIRTAWNFASPDNQRVTGPIERFIPMVKSPGYAPLLNFKSVAFSPTQQKNGHAIEAVAVTQTDGTIYYYAFELALQTAGARKDCWLTDGVVPLPPPPPAPPAPAPPSGGGAVPA